MQAYFYSYITLIHRYATFTLFSHFSLLSTKYPYIKKHIYNIMKLKIYSVL
ncbi:hypothetical protein H8356DRAFT_944507 [Neocallimastix lanati (nom. inval.)]|nr:hypothetical protein H8356DRAFT_944507 [Neocallimastix sp. JGI-2020a]